MNTIPHHCDIQFFVCVNQRAGSQALPSCGSERGQLIYEQLKLAVTPWARKQGLTVWVNRTLCQGFCSPQGVTVCVFPSQLRIQALNSNEIPELLSLVEKELSKKSAGHT